MLEIVKNTIAKNFNGYIVLIVVMNFRKNFSIAKIFPSRFPGIFANILKRKIIPVYSSSQKLVKWAMGEWEREGRGRGEGERDRWRQGPTCCS